MVTINGTPTEVRIQNDIVQALIKWNGASFVYSVNFDIKFIKALLISFVGANKIIENDIPAAVVDLIRDLFAVRSKDNREKFSSFEILFEKIREGIQQRT